MPRTQVSCPNCRQPVMAEITQLFDVNQDPSAKSRLLSGAANIIQCPVCGYQGLLATPIVYHDPEKELLLTFVPAELGLPRNEQERMIGNLINQVISKLPQEKRKGYLLNPQATLTQQGLIERVLEADGITREMIQAQQQRLNLLQRLANASDEQVRDDIIRQEEALIDADFFSLLARLAEVSIASGDRESARRLAELQKGLMENTKYGREIQAQSKEIETALQDLQAAGKDLSRDQLLEMVISASSDVRLGALVSFARPMMDYAFFQALSERIDRSRGDGRARLVELRTRLLEMTQEIDRAMEAHRQQIRQVIQSILQASDIPQAMTRVLSNVDEMFMAELDQMLKDARKQGDLERSSKLQQMIQFVEEASAPPPELSLVEEYLDNQDEGSRQKFLEAHQDQITPEFMEMLANIVVQVQSGEDQELTTHVIEANRQALRFTMRRSMLG